MSGMNKATSEQVTETRSRFRDCGCVVCGECWGSGRVMVRTGGYPEEDLEQCGECDGHGIVEECWRCEFDREMDGVY